MDAPSQGSPLGDWDSIRDVQNSRLLRSSYVWLVIVPVIANLMSLLDETIELEIQQTPIILNVSLPFSWEILYWSAVAFAISNAFYLIFCPSLVRKYKNFSEFLINDGDMSELVGLARYLNRYKKKGMHVELSAALANAAISTGDLDKNKVTWKAGYPFGAEPEDLLRDFNSTRRPSGTEAENLTRELFVYCRRNLLEDLANARRVSTALLFLGFGGLMFIAVQNFIFVVNFLYL